MSIPEAMWLWVADKEHARSVNPSLGRWKLKSRRGPPGTSVLLPLPYRLAIPGPADVWFTPLWLGRGNWTVRYLVSGHPLNRCICLIYEAGNVQLHGWSFFHAGWVCLWMPVSDSGEEIGWVQFLGLMPGTMEGVGVYAILFQLESLFNYTQFIDQSKA